MYIVMHIMIECQCVMKLNKILGWAYIGDISLIFLYSAGFCCVLVITCVVSRVPLGNFNFM